LNDILHHIERGVGKPEGSTSLAGNLRLSDLFEEFFVGLAQDKNMSRFADFVEANHPNLEEGSPDFHQAFNLTQEQKLADFY
jgi:hypothetical protein